MKEIENMSLSEIQLEIAQIDVVIMTNAKAVLEAVGPIMAGAVMPPALAILNTRRYALRQEEIRRMKPQNLEATRAMFKKLFAFRENEA